MRAPSRSAYGCAGGPGGRREPAASLNGMAHFIEHMVFKGTERRSAEQIAREVDSVGGMLDAFTSKEATCFNSRVLGVHLPLAFDVLSDMVLRPLFAPEDIAKEKRGDSGRDSHAKTTIRKRWRTKCWRRISGGGHPLGWPIISATRRAAPVLARIASEMF